MGFDSNFLFEVIEDGSIAYMKFVTMLSKDFEPDMALMTGIYEQIQGFEHLILDIRGNPGGQPIFLYMVLSPNIAESMSAPLYGFYIAGEQNVRFLDVFNFYPTPASQVDMELSPELNENDLSKMDYMIELFWDVDHDPDWIDVPPFGFDGKLWLLIDGDGHSASEIAAYMSKQSGIVTLVGEQSGGCVGGTEAAWVSLPNSGIIFKYDPVLITDMNGVNINEFPTLPHYFNRPGMDALETTLAIINEQLTINN